jgi:creatinine amidohydrolase
LVDANSTSFEWADHPTDVCLLPVGSFEQHSHHMPLDTDSIIADYWGRFLAEELDCALLPTLRITTSMEHSGFRGSMTLKPETLMQVIRDIADDLESQGFRILIVLSCHGGNHCLVPAARHINRQERDLRILLMNGYGHGRPDIKMDAPASEIHAGEWETSVLMAIRPDLVKERREDIKPDESEFPLKQPDLTMWGMIHFSEHGALGYPSLASEEKGKAIVEACKKSIVPWTKDRIRRLRELTYSGKQERRS